MGGVGNPNTLRKGGRSGEPSSRYEDYKKGGLQRKRGGVATTRLPKGGGLPGGDGFTPDPVPPSFPPLSMLSGKWVSKEQGECDNKAVNGQ